jgi:Lon protease-like protein
MVTDSVEQDRMIGVCHTRKEIRSARHDQTVQDALNSNQATYEPCKVFSAGPCEILETTSDGRVYINIKMEKRLQLVDEIQTLPYRIVSCTELKDTHETDPQTDPDPSVDTIAIENDLQTSITRILKSMIGRYNPAQLASFEPQQWIDLDSTTFSFQVFQLLRFAPDVMQSILEMTNAAERLQLIDSILTNPTGNNDH